MPTEDFDAALASGRLPNLDAVLQVREGEVAATGMRSIDVHPLGGIATRILPDRGLDIGQAWFAGSPLAWVSRIGERAPVHDLRDLGWSSGFGGGLVVTCGLRNVGAPSKGRGLHGTYAHLPAADVTVDRHGGSDPRVVVTGVVVDDLEDPTLRVVRTITTHAERGRVELVDLMTNLGDVPAEAPVLYHCNFGYPLWTGDATLSLPEAATTPRDDASATGVGSHLVPPHVAEGPEWVFEHRLASGAAGRASIRNVDLGLAVDVLWDPAELAVLNQWIDANPGMAVLGIEPANCTTRGRAYERAHGGLPTIAPGATRRSGVVVEANRL